ncbi:MAG TPA: hypothetical protein VEY91_12395 [Candidatus Limnocylindria bacterium]|nr:hypothetical protein [Candidatus Limnocylindria bacterium]
MNLDWRRLKAVVLESDDWGFCAWAPDEQAFRVLADTPSWRGPAGRIYGRSTLESAQDVDRIANALLEFRGGDGLPPIWQANTIVAAPDFSRLTPPQFEVPALPLVDLPDTPSRWQRSGMWQQVGKAIEVGVWWPELHGLHHVPESAWLRALRRGIADARRAHEQQCVVCEAVEASGEYDPSEPAEDRSRNLELAFTKFRDLFGRAPTSLCAPDYRWDESFEADAERLGVVTLQGRAEQAGHPLPRLRHLLHQFRWPDLQGRRFYLPPRIAFEPRGGHEPRGRLGPQVVQRRAREAWGRGQPAVISTHRANYAHLDPGWSEAGRGQLRDLLHLLVGEGAVFLTDFETRQLVERGWSVRPIGSRGILLRHYGVPREPVRFPAPAGVTRVGLRDAGRRDEVRLGLEDGEVRAEVNPGEYLLEWRTD